MSWAADANLTSGCCAAASAGSEGIMRRWRDMEEKETGERGG